MERKADIVHSFFTPITCNLSYDHLLCMCNYTLQHEVLIDGHTGQQQAVSATISRQVLRVSYLAWRHTTTDTQKQT